MPKAHDEYAMYTFDLERSAPVTMVTHEEEYGRIADRIVHLDDGKVVFRAHK